MEINGEEYIDKERVVDQDHAFMMNLRSLYCRSVARFIADCEDDVEEFLNSKNADFTISNIVLDGLVNEVKAYLSE